MGKTIRALSDFGSGIIAGLTIGLVTAILIAPKEGEETRQLLSEGAEEALSKPREIADGIQSRVARAIEEGKQAAAEARAEMEASAGIRRI